MTEIAKTSSLNRLNLPQDIAGLSSEELTQVAAEVRSAIIDTVSQNGGHLAPSLGVVELTMALLKVFNPAQDKIIWDVGHQAYAWKLLTGRAQHFYTLRRKDGICGFPKTTESPYDHFGVGHSSTSISAALGMAVARDLAEPENNKHVVAIIGDGAMTAGMAFEGLNQAGAMDKRLIVILNDNEMSISHNVGALSLFLSRNLSKSWAMRFKRDVGVILKAIPRIGYDMFGYAKRTEQSFKSFFTPGMLFEAFQFSYIGPVDGHDVSALVRHLEIAKENHGPVLLHVLTKKGKGYAPAEANPALFHGIGRFDKATGRPHAPSTPSSIPSFTKVFGNTLCQLAEHDPRVMAITAAMPAGTGTKDFSERFPDRFVDVGICEQHAVTFAAGLAMSGERPFVAVYSTFMQRAYDQILHDVCLQHLPVTFCLDRAGLVGEDGPTHHGAFDVSFLRHMPDLAMLAPRDEADLQRAMVTALHFDAPIAIRYPRGAGYGVPLAEDVRALSPFPLGQGEVVQEGTGTVIIAIGSMVHPALQAAKAFVEEGGAPVTVFDARWVKPLPTEQLREIAKSHDKLLFIEENTLAGGFSSAVLELFVDEGVLQGQKVKRLALPDAFVPQGTQKELRAELGLDVDGILKVLREL